MRINATGSATIFRHEGRNGKPSYTVQMSKKVKKFDGTEEWVGTWLFANFRKGVELANKTKIDIKSAWLDWYDTDVNGKVVSKFGLFINEFDADTTQPDSFNSAEEEIPF